MSTKPKHDHASIALDAIRLHDVAVEDVGDHRFAAHVSKQELASFAANIAKLQHHKGDSTSRLHSQVAAGVHVAEARTAVAHACRAIHAAADLAFEHDVPLRRAFGYGLVLQEGSTSSVELYAHTLLAAASAHPKEAPKAHLDAKGVHHLEDLLVALEHADVAHTRAGAGRHDATLALDSLAHLVTAEAAHLRFVARRVFTADETKLARYASTLPRHAVQHRTRHTPDPVTPPETKATS